MPELMIMVGVVLVVVLVVVMVLFEEAEDKARCFC